MAEENRAELNRNLAQMLKGGVIMDVTTPEQAKIAQDAGACAVMALERIPADIRAAGGVSRMSDPAMIKGIQEAVTIPVMAKVRIGHITEARILQAIDIDYIDESEVLSPADDVYHIDKTQFKVPFVCGAKHLGEALRRIAEGAAMIRTKGEPGTGDVIQAVRHMRTMNRQIHELQALRDDEIFEAAKKLEVPYDLAKYVHDNGRLPVVNFAAGGVATPADAALMMELGAEGVFVGSGIFKSGDPAKRAAAIVQATANWQDADLLARLSENLGEAMVGINEDEIKTIMAARGECSGRSTGRRRRASPVSARSRVRHGLARQRRDKIRAQRCRREHEREEAPMVVAVQYIEKEQGGDQTHDVTGILAVQGAFAEHAATLD